MPAERLDEKTLNAALSIALASGQNTPSAAQMRALLEFAQHAGGEWFGWRWREPQAITGTIVALVLPGRTALIIAPAPGQHGMTTDGQCRALSHALGALAARRLHYAQALVDSGDAQTGPVLAQAGFRFITNMLYLERDARYPWVEPPGNGRARWVAYCPSEARRFEETAARTYNSSLDCPELTGIRPMADVMLSHRAGGRFRSECWELLELDGDVAGCVLLAELPHVAAAEVAYMGVVPECRGRGAGELLMRRGLELARRIGAKRLTLAVDERNAPARKLYQRFDFEEIARRAAYFFRWSAA